MTDYYVTGTGYTAYGPYTLKDARIVARALAHDLDGERSVHILATAEESYSRCFDDELPTKPTEAERESVFTPWDR